ncbi:MAG: EscU/YscU/HrcU family type III secretion system export apparatus switch protein [Sphingomonadales bacterium]|nr:EscU/YscU/HrcU family type III secretion system export apparatus switch protein [Sphingomonadales bacterium]
MSGEKNLAPTEKRRREAARKGDVLRSREVATALALLVGSGWLKLAGPWLFSRLSDALRTGLSWDRRAIEHFDPGGVLLAAVWAVTPPLLMLGMGVVGSVTAAQLAHGDGRWVGSNLAIKGSRLNPLSGLKRMFGAQGWIEVGKGILKVGLLGGIVYAWAQASLADLLGLGRGASLGGSLRQAWDAVTTLLFALSGGLVLIALIDWPVQWMRRFMRLRMSQQEMRDEHKESEGSPERKAAQRHRQRQYASGAVAKAMTEAQFVLTNPSHFSVAMGYDPGKAGAPIVLAKGRGEKALAMRDLARDLAVPLIEAPALARSVYFTTREQQMIREELYAAVAAVLAYVFSLRRGETRPLPPIEVPLALRFDAEGRSERPA